MISEVLFLYTRLGHGATNRLGPLAPWQALPLRPAPSAAAPPWRAESVYRERDGGSTLPAAHTMAGRTITADMLGKHGWWETLAMPGSVMGVASS